MFPSFRRVSLRAKLVASAVALVFAALTVIGVSSALLLHKNLLDRVDTQLGATASTIDYLEINNPSAKVYLTPSYVAQETTPEGGGQPMEHGLNLSTRDLPPIVTGVDAIRS